MQNSLQTNLEVKVDQSRKTSEKSGLHVKVATGTETTLPGSGETGLSEAREERNPRGSATDLVNGRTDPKMNSGQT